MQLGLPAAQHDVVGGFGSAEGGCQGRVKLVVELQVQDAEAVAFRADLVPLGSGDTRDQAFAAKLAQVIAQLVERVVRVVQSEPDIDKEILGAENPFADQVGEAEHGLQNCQQPGIVQAQSRSAATARRHGGLTHLFELTAIKIAGQDVLFDVEKALIGALQNGADLGQVVEVLAHGQILELKAGAFRAQSADVGAAVFAVLLEDRVLVAGFQDRQVQLGVFDGRRAGARVGDVVAAAEDDGQLVGMTQAAVGVEQAVAEVVEGLAILEDEVVAVFHLAHVQLLAVTLLTLLGAKEWQQPRHPGMHRLDDVFGSEGIAELLQTLGPLAGGEQVSAVFIGDPFVVQLLLEPVVAVEPNGDVEREVRADAQEHAAAVLILEIEVVEQDVAAQDGDVVGPGLVASDAFGFAQLEDDGDPFALPEVLKVWLDQVFAFDLEQVGVLLRLEDVEMLVGGVLVDPVVIVVGDPGESGPRTGDLAFLTQEPADSAAAGGVLEGTNHAIEDNAIETRVFEADIVAVVL